MSRIVIAAEPAAVSTPASGTAFTKGGRTLRKSLSRQFRWDRGVQLGADELEMAQHAVTGKFDITSQNRLYDSQVLVMGPRGEINQLLRRAIPMILGSCHETIELLRKHIRQKLRRPVARELGEHLV